MAVCIRLRREGTKDRPFYRIVAADERYRRDGRFLEVLGTYDPSKDDVKLSVDRVDDWVSKGARPSETVSALVKKAKLAAK